MRILVVEDEPRIAADITTALGSSGFVCDVSTDGEEAWFKGDTENYSLVVLDLGLPTIDGLSVLKRWRAAGRDMPVLILTARGAWPERVEGIDAGADDYLVKPFQMEELIARARALIRRSRGISSPVIEAGRIRVDTRQMRVLVDDAHVSLTPLEYRLVSFLVHNKGRVVSTTELLEHLYGDDDSRETNALEAAIMRVRKKLGTGSIETRRGYGYIIMDEAS
ncbi:Transcriptional regulatory protein PmrA [Candidatus Filomicrobium marinum]|uniref:Transcriptional regulatory protein PmrA n=2 Tax=Filomicrobium TaxID=119044 RepID=A0A0D6JHC0_9HYPH|nr:MULTISPECIES: response regulator transcription factor [Filomicrobium]MCV0369774.1 response regulator transcription factor [Filomicrobium sp.]CFX50098.1 Transcriptional regulatory protein PmrA [Candidatus Filomicrobium marinum]CPR20259.1 Transcriptional regulatory protein PmrA [Candidatus Filomicrobium marinum]SDP12552.1 two component transcriptional regulator, winged helix family [Filomicrobium insigne]